MAFTHITDDERAGKGVTGLSDTPGLSAAALQERFDSLGNLAITGLNRFLNELEGETGSSSIGVQVPVNLTAESNLQAVINAIAALLQSTSNQAHRHSNKSVLDGISVQNKADYDELVTKFGGINSVELSVTDSDKDIPSGSAIVSYMAGEAVKKIIVNTIYPVGSVYVSTSNLSPSALFGGVWEVTDIGLKSGYAFRRTS